MKAVGSSFEGDSACQSAISSLLKDVGATPIISTTIMNDDNKINFAYIAGKNHGRVDITPEQLNNVMKIIYGKT